MKKFLKIYMSGSVFVLMGVMGQVKISNATPNNFRKQSTVNLLSQVILNPEEAFIKKLPDGKLRASFLHSGQRSIVLHNFNVKHTSSVYVRKIPDGKFKYMHPTRFKKRMVEEGTAFRVDTHSKDGLRKEINITRENEDIVVTSEKGRGTPKYSFKKTILKFGDEPSTSTQSSSLSTNPRIIVNKYSSYNEESKNFDIESNDEYNPAKSKLISHITKNNLTKMRESTIIHDDDIKTRIIENPDGSEHSFITDIYNDTLLTKLVDPQGNTTITKKVQHPYTYYTKKYDAKQNLLEEILHDQNSYEWKKYDQNGSLLSNTIKNTLSNGSTIETSTSQTASSTYERRSDGSLISIISRTPSGELIKQDFDTNSNPLNYPYKIN